MLNNVSFSYILNLNLELSSFRFFDIGTGKDYFNEPVNTIRIRAYVDEKLSPFLRFLLKSVRENSFLKESQKQKHSIYISGNILRFLPTYPKELALLKELLATGHVELLSGTYSYGLSSLMSNSVFIKDVNKHKESCKDVLGEYPSSTFLNTDLIYSDSLGMLCHKLGFDTVITEGVPSVMSWRSPNYVYCHPESSSLSIVLRNKSISDYITYKGNLRPSLEENASDIYTEIENTLFSLSSNIEEAQSSVERTISIVVNIDELLSQNREAISLIALILNKIAFSREISILLLKDLKSNCSTRNPLYVPTQISWSGKYKDTSHWLGNDMQMEILSQLGALSQLLSHLENEYLHSTLLRFTNVEVFRVLSLDEQYKSKRKRSHFVLGPYISPYNAFINIMNIFTDFESKIGFLTQTNK